MTDSLTRGAGKTVLGLLVAVALLVLSPVLGLIYVVCLVLSGVPWRIVADWIEDRFTSPESRQLRFKFDDEVI